MITNRLQFVETENSESVEEAKKRLRAYMKERRGENENRDVKEYLLVENLCRALESLAKKRTGAGTERTAFVYCSFSSEAPTDNLVETLSEKGWRVYCPRLENGEMVAVECGEDFALSPLGIREPCGEVFGEDTAVAVIPMLAVDESGNRLGYGGGYYDRYLKKHPKTVRIAYGFDFQLLKRVPHDERDERMDVIVTDKRVVETGAR